MFIVYLPCFDFSPLYDAESEMCFQFTRGTLLQFVLNNGCYIIGGDFNCCTFQNDANNRVNNLLNNLQAKSALLCYTGPM